MMNITINKNSTTSLYQQLAGKLRDSILCGRLKPGTRLPSAQEMTQKFDLSIITVNNALKILVDEGLLTRRPKQGTFVRENSVAPEKVKRDEKERRRRIMIVISNVAANDAYIFKLLHVITDRFKMKDMDVMLSEINNRTSLEEIDDIASNSDAIVMCGYNSLSAARRLKNSGRPLVLLGDIDQKRERGNPPDVNMIIHDEKMNAILSTEHLLSLGHERIALVSGPAGTNLDAELQDGYIQAFQQNGKKYDKRLIFEVDGHTLEEGLSAGEKILSGSTKNVTAISVCDDRVAAGIMQIAARLGIKIPEELSIVSRGNMMSEALFPPLTTTASFPEQSAMLAAEKISEALNGKPLSNPELVFIGTPSLLQRESTSMIQDKLK